MTLSQTENIEQRQFQRIPTQHIIQFSKYELGVQDKAEFSKAALKNISSVGMLFSTSLSYHIGDILNLKVSKQALEAINPKYNIINNDHIPESISILATVVRVEIINSQPLFDLGVSFVAIDEADRLIIEKYVQSNIKTL